MGCMCERTRIKHKPRKKLNKTDQKYRDCNKAQPYENFTYEKGHVTINYNVNEETTSNVPSDYLDEVGNFIASKLVKLNNSISSKSNLITSSHYLVRHSLSLYAASSVIIALCYLTTSTTALETSHPITENATIENESFSVNGSKAAFNTSIFAEGKSDKEILDHLLKNSRYDKRLLPPVDGTLTVNVNVLLLSLASPDESSLKYEVEFLLNQQWYDPRLRYANHSQYEYLNAIHHHDDIWLPDTYFIMHGDFKHPLVPMHFALRIFRNGTITYSMRRHLILSCQGSLNIFPFDDPLCSFALESISYELSAITYVWKNDEDTLRKSPSLTTLNAYLIKNSTIPCPVKNSWREDEETEDDKDYVCSLCQKRIEPQGNYSCLKVDLIFTRDRAFYFTTVFIPGIILVTSSFITFWLEWNAVPARSMIGNYSCLQVDLTFTRDRAFYFTTVFIPGIILVTSSFITFWLEWNAVPARVMIGVTTMLNFFTTSNSFRGTLPVVSNLTAMNVWDGVCMCFIYASLLEFVCVNYVGRKRPLHNVVYRPGENPVTQRLPAVLSRIGIILASPLEIIEQEFLAAVSSEKSDQQPHHTGGTLRPNLRRRTTVQSGDSSRARGDTDESFHLRVLRTGENMTEGDTNVNDGRALISSSSTSPSSASPPTSPLSNVSYTSSIMSPPSIIITTATETELSDGVSDDVERGEERCPIRPPRRKMSRSHTIDVDITPTATSPQTATSSTTPTTAILESPSEKLELETFKDLGEKKRDTGGPNEIVACTNCGGGTSPCTHSANNGCATETCFVQVRKKEPPHPIRVAKTIDVIARITFPTAYAIFLIFFFVHYKGST